MKYRFIISDGDMLPTDSIQEAYDAFAGAATPSPVPMTTVKPAEGAGKTPGGAKTQPAPKAAKVPAEPKQ